MSITFLDHIKDIEDPRTGPNMISTNGLGDAVYHLEALLETALPFCFQ